MLLKAIAFRLFHNGKVRMNGKDSLGKITSFEVLTLRLSGMRSTQEYEFVCQGDETLLYDYMIMYGRGEDADRRREDGCAHLKTEEVIAKFNEWKLGGWNGFDGPNPPGVLDGTMFMLTGKVNDGKTLRAEGSNNFPEYYHDMTRYIYDRLREAEDETKPH